MVKRCEQVFYIVEIDEHDQSLLFFFLIFFSLWWDFFFFLNIFSVSHTTKICKLFDLFETSNKNRYPFTLPSLLSGRYWEPKQKSIFLGCSARNHTDQ